MAAYILRRLAYAVLILAGVNLLTFTLFFAINSPDNIARLNIGGKRVTHEAIEKWKVERGYDKPLWFNRGAQGFDKIRKTIFYDRSLRLFTLNFGSSDAGRDIAHEIGNRIGPSLALMLPMLALTVAVGIAFSLLLVFFRASYLDFWGTVLCVLMMSISSLFYIIMAQWFFGKMLRVVPISGFAPGLDLAKFLLLPVIVGIVYQLGSEARLFRAMLLEEIGKDYVRTARAKGLAESTVLFRHVLRNTWLPILTHVGALIPYAFLGSLVFESFFGIPGLGSYTIEAINAQDFAIVHAMVFLGSMLYILAYLATDIAYTWVDPRVRLAG
ncbi:MAG: ABC transporter permease [Burkholderiaceae bacterium]